MARPDWGAIQKQFLADHAKSNISPKDWCESQGINYATARRYVKKPAQSAQETAQKKVRNAQIEKSAEELIDDDGLTDQQRIFVAEYLKDSNATQAAIRAGYSKKTAEQIGYQLLQKTSVSHALGRQKKSSIARTIETADEILSQMWQLATFDANEISEFRRGCCRRCWSVGHKYHWTEDEYEEACEKAEVRDKPIPDCSGGTDYLKTREPNPECPHCGGEGIGRVHMHDTRELSPIARLAYSGTKVSKGGVEIATISREKMLEHVARFIGLGHSPEDRELKRLEIERRKMENERLRAELALHNDDEPITEMEVTIVGQKDKRDDDGASGEIL